MQKLKYIYTFEVWKRMFIILANGYTLNTRPCLTREDPVGYSRKVYIGLVFCVETYNRIINQDQMRVIFLLRIIEY